MSRRTWDGSTPREWLKRRLRIRLVAVPPSGPAFYAVINEVLEEVREECRLIELASSLRSGKAKPFLLQVQSYLARSGDDIQMRLFREAWKDANPKWRNRQKRNKENDGTSSSSTQ